ncbi:MAG: glycerophosphodiester phosphodiesterase [Actinomycetota bacterium]|nr:glycerophosphodiester phosphodiesterase [Actinomycetota bacterium]
MNAYRRVGHKGADLLVPGNTLASFDAALAVGVDMIEFDVLPERGTGRLILAHDPEAGRHGTPPTLEEGLAHLASPRFAGIELDVDLKAPGYEDRVVRALQDAGLVDRSLVSSQHPKSLDRVRTLEPALRLGWSVPRAASDYTATPGIRLPVLALLWLYAHTLRWRAPRAIRARRCDALMSHWRLVTPRLVHAVRSAGGELYVWTVDDSTQIRRLVGMGVTGVISNDPRLFASPAVAS